MSNVFTDMFDFLKEGVDSLNKEVKEDIPRKIAKELRDEIRNAIFTSSPPGESWPDLSENTLKIRRSKGIPHDKPFLESTDMVDSISIKPSNDSIKVGWFGSYKSMKAHMSIFGTGGSWYVRNKEIPVSDSMAMYMAAQYGVLLGHKVDIPPRRLFVPVMEKVLNKYDSYEFVGVEDSKDSLCYSIEKGDE